MSDERTIVDVTRELGEADEKWKTGEAARGTLRVEFFEMATEAKKSETLAQKTVSVGEFSTEEEALAWIGKHYPTWTFLSFQVTPDESDVVALLEEDPEKLEYTFINPIDNKVYRKQVVAGGTLFDEEALQEEDPELWKRVSYLPKVERKLKKLDNIDEKDVAKMQKYMYPGKPQIKLAAPREATEKDLETQDGDD